jgi:antitoxin HicB
MSKDADDLAVLTPAELAAAERETEARIAAARARPPDPELERRVQEIVARPYPVVVWRDPDGYYVADAPDLEGCLGTGDSAAAAIDDLHAAMAAWAEARLVAGLPIPEPSPAQAESRYSGRVLVRMPKSLHRDLARAAQLEGGSINQVAVALLAAGVGRGDIGLAASAVRALDTTGLQEGTPEYEFRRLWRDGLIVLASGRRWDAATDGAGERGPTVENQSMRALASIPRDTGRALLEWLGGLLGFSRVTVE